MQRIIFIPLFMFVFFSTSLFGQTLTISSGGQTGTSGTNWSVTGNTLTVTGSANIDASVIVGLLSSNSLSIQGNSTSFAVNVSQAITSGASGNGLTIGAANNSGNISLNNPVSLAGAMTIFGGRVNIMDTLSLSSSNNLTITSINTVIIGTTTVGGSATVNASGNFILGTNIALGTGFPLTASGGFTKTGAGTSYLFSNINTTNTAVAIEGPVVVGNFNTSNATTQINTNGGNISIPGAVSAYSGTGREYTALVYASLYDAVGGAVTGSTTDIYLRFNAGNQSFVGIPGMPATFSMQYLVVAGGGGGGTGWGGYYSGGGGGGGGVADGTYSFTGSPLSISVGTGGGLSSSGNDSYLENIKSGGGGGGGNYNSSTGLVGTGGIGYTAGGGGGGAGSNTGSGRIGGTGTQRNGGYGAASGSLTNYGGAGGGAVGNGSGYNSGGLGYSSNITGIAVAYGAGAACGGTPIANTGGGGGSQAYGTYPGAVGAVILRFALPNATALDAASLSTALHLNAIAGSVTLGSTVANLSNIEITAGIASSITGPITGTGSLLKTGTGALTLSGDNRYTGGTTVTTGTLVLNDTAPIDGMGVIVGTLNINQNGTVQLTGNAAALGYNANRVTKININGGVLETSSGQQHIWDLTGGLNFNGGGTVKSNGGTSDAAATSYFEWGVTNITVANPTSAAVIAGRINLRNDLGNSVFTVADGAVENDLLISAAITQANGSYLTKTGAGKLTFTGINSYSGTTTINAGTLQIGDGGTLGTISSAGVTNNAALVFNRSNDFTISNAISGTGTVTKSGAGVLTLSGGNSYTGLTTISQGILKCGSTNALGTIAGSTTIVDGAALDLNGLNYSTAEPLTINGTGVSANGVISNSTTTAATFAGPITLASNATINGKSADLTLSGTINGAYALEVTTTNKAFTQTGIVGGTTPPVSYTINAGTGLVTKDAAATVAGPITLDGGQLSLSSTTSSTLANAAITARSKTYIKNASATSFTTQGGDVLLASNIDDATDNDTTTNGYIQFLSGLTITTNDGNITLGGGDATASGYALGTSAYPFEGIRANGTINLNSGGGAIVMRGKSYAANTTWASWGMGFWDLTTGAINSGTGTILLDGFSQSSGSPYSSALFSNGALTITSANTTADAIRMIGKSTGTSSDAWGIEAESALSVLATGDGGGITISTSQQVADNYDAVFRGETNILAKNGPIQLLGKQDGGVANGRWFTGSNFYLGSKASTTVPTSSSNIVIQYDKFDFPGTKYIATTGTINFQPASDSFGQEVYTSWFNWNQNSQTMSGLTIGKSGNTTGLTHQTTAITVAGPIEFYAGTITLSTGLTTTNNGNISFYSDNAIGGLSAQRNVTAAGAFNYIPQSNSFSAAVTYPITNLNLSSSGLLIGKLTNTANITFANATSIAGPITAYGGTITLNANLTATNNGSISLYTDNTLGGLTTARTVNAAAAFKLIPRTTAFAVAITYPITNLSVTATGLTIGNTTNDKDITINQDVIGGAGIELFGANVNINANLKTTSSAATMYLKGNTTINALKYIESNGDFTHDGNLTFKSDANGTAAFGPLGGTLTTVSGTATVERFVPAKRAWRLLTAPLQGATNTTIPSNWQGINGEGLLLFGPTTYQSNTMTGYTTGGGSPNIWKYNNGWQNIPNLTSENLFTSAGNNGFLVFATGPQGSPNITTDATETTLKPKGDLITGNVTHTLTANQYKLIANPYASPINTVNLVAANTGSKVWMIDPTLGTYGGYAAYDGTNWTPVTPTTNDSYIQSGQGFFVRTASNATFTISESHKVSGNSNTWFQRSTSATSTPKSDDKIRILLYKQDNAEWKLADGVLAVNSNTGNNAVDETDTNKMTNFNENIMFRNGTTNLAIEYSALPQVGYVQPMRLTATTIQPYQLRLFTENYTNASVTPLLEDTVAGTFTPIPTDDSVLTVPFTGITATSNAPDQRFRIVYQKGELSNVDFTPLWAAVYPNPVKDGILNVHLNTLEASTNFTLTNLVGQLVHQGKLENIQNTVALPQLPEGMYMLSITQEGKQYNSKIYIK
nr:autotransporter-associated beta strand repeat-containing protein [uncultured Flavobacterium sp.]